MLARSVCESSQSGVMNVQTTSRSGCERRVSLRSGVKACVRMLALDGEFFKLVVLFENAETWDGFVLWWVR